MTIVHNYEDVIYFLVREENDLFQNFASRAHEGKNRNHAHHKSKI